MRWLVDFDAAVTAGMAMRIPITAQQRQAGFDRVLVYGLLAGDASAPVAALLDAHHYSDGLAFVPQGAPTNNTADAASAYSRKDPGELISFAVELGPALTGEADADGPVAAGLLGLPVTTFDHVRFADRHDMRDGQDMLTALWPATLGYFLRQLGDGSLTEAQSRPAPGRPPASGRAGRCPRSSPARSPTASCRSPPPPCGCPTPRTRSSRRCCRWSSGCCPPGPPASPPPRTSAPPPATRTPTWRMCWAWTPAR